jgi:DNA-binding NarL/FixJ family response regulator
VREVAPYRLCTPFETANKAFIAMRVRGAAQLDKLTILLADDHRPFLKVVEGLLLSVYDVVGRVPDGQAVIRAARLLKPDIILMDISMPILNGIDASKQLNESGCCAKIVFLTAHSDMDFVDACLGTGALGFVTKSRMTIDLLPALKEAVAGRIFISPLNQG